MIESVNVYTSIPCRKVILFEFDLIFLKEVWFQKYKKKIKMSNFKVVTLFHANEKIPFMTCMVKDVEEHEQGVKLTLENGNSIYINDYDSFSCLNQRMISIRKEWLMCISD